MKYYRCRWKNWRSSGSTVVFDQAGAMQILHVAVALVLRHCAATDSGHASVCLRRRLRRGGRVVVVGWRFGTSPFTHVHQHKTTGNPE